MAKQSLAKLLRGQATTAVAAAGGERVREDSRGVCWSHGGEMGMWT